MIHPSSTPDASSTATQSDQLSVRVTLCPRHTANDDSRLLLELRTQYVWCRVHRIASIILLLAVTGCASGLMSLPERGLLSGFPDLKKKKEASEVKKARLDNDFGTRADTPLLSEYISVQGNHLVVLRGVGLVTGLDGTGDDPAPSSLRSALQNEMNRRGIKNPSQILASKNTSLVVVTAYLPAMVREGQRFDVRVAVPPSSKTTSLKGGWLLETRLFEEQNVDGQSMKGHEYGVAGGAILTETGIKRDPGAISGELRRGTIPGGALSKTDRNLQIVLRSDKRGFRNSKRIAGAVAERFHDYNRYGQRNALAEAKTDTMIERKMHKRYRNNFPRYQQVIRSIAFNETDVARRMRMETLEESILNPATALQSSLQMEAIGDASIPFLKRAMNSDNFEVRFHAAQSLAYLGDGTGVAVLKQAVEEQPALRVYSLAALSVVDDADAVMALRDLMNADQLETRYGAFKALQELDPRDPSLRRATYENQFTLFLIDSTGEAMSHVTRRRNTEIVLFGADQPIRLPAVLNAGRNIRVIGDAGSSTIQVTKYSLELEEPARTTIPNRLADIIQACGEYGATYPDIVQLMIEAEQQHNLYGEFGIDRLPQAGRMYFRDEDGDGDAEDERRIGTPAMIPNLFDKLEDDELREQQHESDAQLEKLKFEDVSTSEEDTSDTERNAAIKAASQANSDGSADSGKQFTEPASSENRRRLQANALADEDFGRQPEASDQPDSRSQTQNSDEFSDGADTDFEDPGAEQVDMSRMDSGITSGMRKIFSNPFSKRQTP